MIKGTMEPLLQPPESAGNCSRQDLAERERDRQTDRETETERKKKYANESKT